MTIKEVVRRTVPSLFVSLRTIKYKVLMEYRVLRRLSVSGLLKAVIGHQEPWQKLLPFQLPLRFHGHAEPGADLLTAIAGDAHVAHGGHAVYLPPLVWCASALAPLAASYPDDAGLKVIRTSGSVADGQYLSETVPAGKLHRQAHYGHQHLALVANVLHIFGLTPRVYDLVEIEYGGRVWVAYVVKHAPGSLPGAAVYEPGIERIRELTRQGILRLIVPDGFDHPDFRPPFNDNVRTDAQDNFQYVDFQNFTLENHERFIRRVADEAANATHFGDHSVVRGKYLYQSIPGFGRAGKRDIVSRLQLMEGMMAEAGVTVRDRVVLDVGCNVGMMMAQYLARGAAWCHGWDQPIVVPHTEKLMLSLGCTRFSLTGAPLQRSRPLIEDLPPFLRTRLDGCVMSYLAIQGHIGWLDSVRDIPWSFMLYEGHEYEDAAKADDILNELMHLVPGTRVATRRTVRDGDSDPRIVAIITREHASSDGR
ncbi:MAG: hypothetical protein JWM95_2538 [Gemmatimonadetes bacterium]|nr:hypothetical protein [Gemmatimonadota bacterium]